MITISDPPAITSWTVQMLSGTSGGWVDTMAKDRQQEQALESLGYWRMIHPGREFRLVKRVVTETIEEA